MRAWFGWFCVLCNGCVGFVSARVSCAWGTAVDLDVFLWWEKLICSGSPLSNRMPCETIVRFIQCDGQNQVLIDCSGPPDEPRNEETGMARKRDALLSQLERRMALRTLVFCNTIQGCRQASLLCVDLCSASLAGTEI